MMKQFNLKKTFLLVVFGLFSGILTAQLNSSDIFKEDAIVWYGLDFSRAKFIGKFDQGAGINSINEFELINKYIPAWNELVINQPERFDLKRVFRKNYIYNDLTSV